MFQTKRILKFGWSSPELLYRLINESMNVCITIIMCMHDCAWELLVSEDIKHSLKYWTKKWGNRCMVPSYTYWALRMCIHTEN